MNTKRIVKIISILLLIAILCSAFSIVFATGDDGLLESATKTDATGVTASAGLTGTTQRVIGIVKYICYAAAVIMLVILGISYITASPEGKAEIKKTAIQYVIGAALVFAAGAVLQIIQSVINHTVKNS